MVLSDLMLGKLQATPFVWMFFSGRCHVNTSDDFVKSFYYFTHIPSWSELSIMPVTDILFLLVLWSGSTFLFVAQLAYIAFLFPRVGLFNPTRFFLGSRFDLMSRTPYFFLGGVLFIGPVLGFLKYWVLMGPIGLIIEKLAGIGGVVLLKDFFGIIDYSVYLSIIIAFGGSS